VAALLICEGAKVKATNNNRDTPLHMAAYYGQTDMVELLIYL
jgi:ankyrin repeat protein